MSKQTKASQYWAHQTHKVHTDKIEVLCAQALNYMYPAGQAQAGLQLANVEVPYLLEQIEYLRSQLNERDQAAA